MKLYHFLTGTTMLATALAPMAASAKDKGSPVTVAAVRYFMPKTIVTATATLKLKDCAKADAEVELVLSAKADADTSKPYTFEPTTLSSWRQSRDFSISVNSNGTLAGFNSTSEDKTGSIIGNILKAVVSIATVLDVKGGGPSDFCNADTADAMRRAQVIRAQLKQLRPSAVGSPLPGEKDSALADALTKELADIQANQLTIVVAKDVDLGAGSTVTAGDITIDWPSAPFKKWFNGGMLPLALQAVRLTVDAKVPEAVTSEKGCARSVSVPQPAFLTIKAWPRTGATSDAISALSVPAQQFGHVAQICLDAPLFSSRTVNVTFDAYGLMTKMDWKSNARGDAASSALAAIAEQGVALYKAVKPAGETADLKDQGDLLDQKIRVEKLRHCLELIQVGGTCPS